AAFARASGPRPRLVRRTRRPAMIKPTYLAAFAAVAAVPLALGAHEVLAQGLTRTIQLDWSFGPDRDQDEAPQLRFARRGMQASIDHQEAPAVVEQLIAALQGGEGSEVAFALAREAGALACSGRVTGRETAAGTCRFDPSEAFVAELARHDIAP